MLSVIATKIDWDRIFDIAFDISLTMALAAPQPTPKSEQEKTPYQRIIEFTLDIARQAVLVSSW